MRLAPRLLNCRVNMTYFVKNHEILFSYFEENEEQIPWKDNVCCDCETCSSLCGVKSDNISIIVISFYYLSLELLLL